MDRIKLKSVITLEDRSIIEKHPAKDARHFAKYVLDYFELERKEIQAQLSGSVAESIILGKIIPGCVINKI